MSLYFTKLFSTLTDSTIWCEDNPTRIVWIAMLAMADRKGLIHASIPGLANRARVSVDECENALNKFMLPDPYSRTEDHEGRRIERIEGGWRLLNYEKYRELGNDETVRESKRKWAEKNRKKSNKVDSSRHEKTIATQAEAEAEAEAEAVNTPSEYTRKQASAPAKRESNPNVQAILEAYASAVARRPDWTPQPKPPTTKEPKKLIVLRASEADFVGMLERYVELVTALDWAEGKDITFFLRRRTFENCLSGEYGPSQKKTNGFRQHQPLPVESDPIAVMKSKQQSDRLMEIANAAKSAGTNLF